MQVADDSTVEDVKQLIHSRLGLPPCQQELSGWNGGGDVAPASRPPRDSTRLSTLRLGRETHLRLAFKSGPADANGDESVPPAPHFLLHSFA